MKPLRLLCLIFLMLLCGCHEKGGNEDYTQRELPTPERIEIQTGTTTVTYGPESEEYAKIWDVIRPNWWKTAADTPDAAAEDTLFLAQSPAQLKTTSERTTRDSSDTFLCFYYQDTPLTWVNPDGKTTIQLQMVAFLLPPVTDTEENVKGCFTISQTGEIGFNEGLFTYYYPPQIAAGFWDFLLH